jgi:lipoprotein-anchoring transpeptidase ErfK/SrfK
VSRLTRPQPSSSLAKPRIFSAISFGRKPAFFTARRYVEEAMRVQAGKAAVAAAALWMSLATAANAQRASLSASQAPAPVAAQTQTTTPKSQRTILVSLPDHKLALLENGQVKAVYTVAIGKPSTPSPVGHFTVISHVANPTYSHHGRVVGPGSHNPVGTRWMGLSQKGYGIHGTNVPSSIGKSASHGCIRVGQKDLELLFAVVQLGDVVEIRNERDAQVVAVFGGQPQLPAAAPAAVLLAETVAPTSAPAATQSDTRGGE